MTFRFIHTADWQIGKPFGQFPDETAFALKAQRLRAVQAVATLAREHAVDAVLVAGDAFDSNTVADRTLLQAMEALSGYAGPWVFLPGNHDAALSHSVWSRLRAMTPPPNAVIADEAAPIDLWDGRAIVLPAPLRRRRESQDVTTWFATAATPAEALRIGLAHGSLANRLPGSEAGNEIAEDRAAQAGLHYLALGDWHGALNIADRTYYSGTPEPDRHKANDSGFVYLVEIDAPAAPARVTRLPVGRFAWVRHEIELLDGTCAPVLATLEALASTPRDTVLALELTGSVTLAERHRLAQAIERWSARLHHLAVDDTALRDEPTADDLDAIDTAGFVRLAVDRLQAKAADPADPEHAAARVALRMVYLDHVGGGGDGMRLRRIEVRAFRKLGHTVVDGLADGLNVIVGDNEAGKSTLLAALRAVLFERHRVGGKVVSAMLPHGHEARPEITIDFALRGEPFRLRKAFNQRPEAELTLPGGGTITGDAVEDRMADLLGFQAPGNRGSKPEEHQGVYGLLWVDQGLAHEPLNAGAGQDSLSSALESEVGAVLGGERGRHLLARAEERRDTFWDKRDKPRGAFRQSQEQVTALEEQRAALDVRMRRHDEQVAALAARNDILARYRRDDRLAQAVRDAEAARAAAHRVEQLQATLAELRRAVAHTRIERDAAAERVQVRQGLIGRVAATDLAASRAALEAGEARVVLQRAEAAAREAAERLESARARRVATEARLTALERYLDGQKARAALARASQVLAEAEAVAARRREALGIVAGLRITKADLTDLDRLCAARDQARSRLHAASVQITAEAGAPGFAVDGVPHSADEPLLLAHDAVLALPGFGRLRVRPGGGVEALVRAHDEAEARVAAALAPLGCATRAEAADALARRTEAETEAATQQRLFLHFAPDGLEALRRTAATLGAAAAADQGHADPPAAAGDHAPLRAAIDEARRAEAGAAADLQRLDAEREKAGRQAAVLDERAAGTLLHQEDALRAVEAARNAIPDDRMASALGAADDAMARSIAAEASAAAALATADPETATLMLRRAEQAERAIRADIDAVTRDKRDLEIELRTLGQEGFGEQFAEVEGRLAMARDALASLSLQASASRLLHASLAAAQRETRDRWLGPVRERVGPYLRLIQPGTEIVLNEKTFSIDHLLRDGVREPFETLSVGAREQVAVITRLALADILRLAGQPSAIILDDALVNTDEARLDRMHLVLQKAAEHLQVLVLTCRERDFVALGAPIHRL